MKALVVIDVQEEYAPSGALPVERFDETVSKIEELLAAARSSSEGVKVVHVRHVSHAIGDSSFDAGGTGVSIVERVAPVKDEYVLTKQYPGAFSNPALDRFLIRNNVREVFVCGLTSFLCCDMTSREAFQLGYDVYYIEDAISEFSLGELSAGTLHKAISAIQGIMFSQVVTTADAVKLLRRN